MTQKINEEPTGVLWEQDAGTIDSALTGNVEKDHKAKMYKLELVWIRIIILAYLHIGAFYGYYLMFTASKWQTNIFAMFLFFMSAFGVQAGAHRLWTHRSYRASNPLKLFLVICNTIAYQNSIYVWCRDHRVHHKYSETDADPHNASRGFFFSHVGWLLCKKHPQVIEKGTAIDLSDLKTDPFVWFQHKNYFWLMPLACFILPTLIPMFCWSESLNNSWHVAALARWILYVNGTWCINSFNHLYGTRPYDKDIGPVENKYVGYFAFGESWHNFHHTFPWDYRAGEHGGYGKNLIRVFLEGCANRGLAYDLKTVSDEVIKKRVGRSGDGTHPIWGWGDKDMSEAEIDSAVTFESKSK